MRLPALLLIIIVAILSSFRSLGQGLTGTVLDETGEALEAATVIGMNQDSSLTAFSISEENGSFILEGQDIHMIQVSFIGYETQWFNVHTDTSTVFDVGDVVMQVVKEVLPAVNIEARRNRLQLNGDTVNYSTAHLATRPGDVVEDLLDQLPGIEVQSDGTVKAFGEDVQNVLVDGEPFFGKDTRMATKNLAAEAVDKVQVFDKASEYSEFTGVEDGHDEKSINLELKEDFKNGYFGQVDVGYGDQGRFSGRGNINQFGKKHRTSFIGLSNNRNEPGFTMQQYLEFMGGLESFMQEGGRIEIDLNDQAGLPIGENNEPGIHTRGTGGINYTGKWSEKIKSQFHYLYNYNDQDLREHTLQESLIDDDILRVTDTSNILNTSQFHNANLRTTIKPSEHQKITFSLNTSMGFENENGLSSQFSGVNNSEFSSTVLRSDRQSGRSLVMVSSLDYKLKLKNKSSLISRFDATYHTNSRTTDQDLLTNWSTSGNSDQFIRQEYNLNNRIGKFSTNYVLPINNKWTTDISLTGRAQRRHLERPWFLSSSEPENLERINNLSGDVTNNVLAITPQLKLRYVQRSWNVSASLGYSSQHQKADFRNEEVSKNKNYRAWLPAVYGRWELGQSHSLNFDFFSDLILPTAEQLQPTPNFIDPVNLYVGNPELKAMLRHEASLGYFNYSQWYDATTYARLTGGLVRDQINHLVTTDSLLRQSFTPVNTTSMKTAGVTAEHTRPLGSWNINIKGKGAFRHEQGSLFIRNIENEINKNAWRASMGFGHRKVNKWKWGISHQIRRNTTRFSINKGFDQQYGVHTTKAFIQYLPSDAFSFKIDGRHEVYDNPLNIPQNELTIVNVSMTHFFGKEREFRFTLSLYDVLDQNTGINRWAEGNAVIDQRFNNLGRHAMLTFGYNMRGHKKDDNGVINIRVGED